MMTMRSNSFTAGVRLTTLRPKAALPKRASVVSRFSLAGMANAAIQFLAHPGRAVAEAIYQQPITGTGDSGLDFGATLGVVAGGVAGFLGYQLKKQLDKSSKVAGEVLHLSKLRDALEEKLKASHQEIEGLKAAVAKAFAELKAKEAEALERGYLMVAMQQQLVQLKSQLSTADSLIATLEHAASTFMQADSAVAAEASELRRVIASLNADKAELHAAVLAAQAIAADAARDRDAADAQLQHVQGELMTADSKVDQLEVQIKELRRAVTGLQRQVDAEMAAAVAAAAEAKALAVKKASLEAQLANTNTRVSELEELAGRQQVLPLSAIADLELLDPTATPVKAVRTSTRVRRSASQILPDDTQPPSSEAVTPSKMAVARSASARSRVVKAKAGDAAVAKQPTSGADISPAKARACRKTAAAPAVEAEPADKPTKPARAAKKTKKSVESTPLVQEAAPMPRAQLPWETRPRGPSSA